MAEAYVFVGERPSPLAAERGETWETGGLCASTLHDALRAADIDPRTQSFVNLWSAPGLRHPGTRPSQRAVAEILERANRGECVVAMGRIVQRELTRLGVAFIALTHPAARGSIRKRENYRAHVRAALEAA